MKKITKDNTVSIHYKGTLSDGSVFDESKENQPLSFVVGKNQIIQGLEKELIGLQIKDTKKIHVTCNEAYGPINNDLTGNLPKEKLPEQIKEGDLITLTTENGENVPATVLHVTDDFVTLDANHPLAGKDLIFEIEVVDIK